MLFLRLPKRKLANQLLHFIKSLMFKDNYFQLSLISFIHRKTTTFFKKLYYDFQNVTSCFNK
jgi:hypothetical protein